MPVYHDMDPLEPIPAWWTDAWQEFWSVASPQFSLRIKPSNNTVLEVPAGAGNDRAAIAIEANPRWIDATIEAASPGGGVERDLDVYVTSTAKSIAPGSPGEIDNTNYAFALSIQETGVVPGGVAIKRKVGVAHWDGAKFTSVVSIVGADDLSPYATKVSPALTGTPTINGTPAATIDDAIVWALIF